MPRRTLWLLTSPAVDIRPDGDTACDPLAAYIRMDTMKQRGMAGYMRDRTYEDRLLEWQLFLFPLRLRPYMASCQVAMEYRFRLFTQGPGRIFLTENLHPALRLLDCSTSGGMKKV